MHREDITFRVRTINQPFPPQYRDINLNPLTYSPTHAPSQEQNVAPLGT